MSLTPWEAGEELIALADTLNDRERDLREGGYANLADMIHEFRLKVGDEFNKLGTHEFGLPAHDPHKGLRPCEPCKGPGPCLWDPKVGRYACRKCHSQPNDPFFIQAERRFR